MEKHTWNLSSEETYALLKTNEAGLSPEEAKRRLETYGPNAFAEKKREGVFVLFLKQFASPLIYILMAAAGVVFFMGHVTDGIIICIVLVLNATIGTIQEGKAQNTLEALKKFVETSATVIREGKEYIIKDSEVVPGDVLTFREGEKIAADARVVQSEGLLVDESALTGESVPIEKYEHVIQESFVKIADEKNKVFKGTYVTMGSGKAVVTHTGKDTEIGKIAEKVSEIEKEIPLKKEIGFLSKIIVSFAFSLSVLIFFIGFFLGKDPVDLFLLAVSLVVSIVPEGLPIAITLILAMGMWRMAKKNALVKKLQAVEALGQAKIIAVDKTGTITRNEMIVQEIFIQEEVYHVTGEGYDTKGEIIKNWKPIDASAHEGLLRIGKTAALASSARVMETDAKTWKIIGDPTEAAVLVCGEKLGFKKNDLENEFKKIDEIPFDHKKKYRISIYEKEGAYVTSVAGAPESVIKICTNICLNEKEENFSEENKKRTKEIFFEMSRRGLRVIALAEKISKKVPVGKEREEGFIFLGLFGIMDDMRKEVPDAVKSVEAAGIRVVMITGDFGLTAETIARKAGIMKEKSKLLTGEEIELLSDEELKDVLEGVAVFARVTPDQKLRIIRAFQARGEVVAMTGDGVNDALSLVSADLGVSMGKVGTEVAKEASDIVLLDDNFGNIRYAVEEGRNIFRSIKKVLVYLFATSTGEVMLVITGLFLGTPLPLLAPHIIWLNFITDGFFTAALGMEPKDKNLLSEKFIKPKKYILNAGMLVRVFIVSIPMAIGSLFLFLEYYEENVMKGWTMCLITLALFQWFNAMNVRSEKESIIKAHPFKNAYMAHSLYVVMGLQVFAVYSPFMNNILKTTPISLKEWGLAIGVASSVIFIEEIRKFFVRMRDKRLQTSH